MRAQETPLFVCVSVCCRFFLFPSSLFLDFLSAFLFAKSAPFSRSIFFISTRDKTSERAHEKKKLTSLVLEEREREKKNFSRERGGASLAIKKSNTLERD